MNKKVKLYYHKTDGGAEYLTAMYVVRNCASKERNYMAAEELKPCPFCGSSARFISNYDIGCSVCSATVNEQPHLVVKAWNRRPENKETGATIAQQAQPATPDTAAQQA